MGLEPVAEDEEDVIHFEAIYLISIRSHKSTEAVGRTNRKQQQCRVYYSIPSLLQPTVGVEADYSQRIDLRRLQLHSSLHSTSDLTPTNASIYRSTARITFDLQPVLRHSLHCFEPTITVRGYLCQDGQPRRSSWGSSCSCSHSQHQHHG